VGSLVGAPVGAVGEGLGAAVGAEDSTAMLLRTHWLLRAANVTSLRGARKAVRLYCSAGFSAEAKDVMVALMAPTKSFTST
jgi:hypothetical protein